MIKLYVVERCVVVILEIVALWALLLLHEETLELLINDRLSLQGLSKPLNCCFNRYIKSFVASEIEPLQC